MGGELPTPLLAHETGLEVDADLGSPKSPNLSPQDPSAASQPPLSKAVRTSPKRPPPSGRTPTSQAEDQPIIPSYGYKLSDPPVDEAVFVSSYPNIFPRLDPDEDERRPFPSPPPQLYQPEPEPEDDQSGLWWVVLMSGIAAFAGGFFGKFLGGKASDAT